MALSLRRRSPLDVPVCTAVLYDQVPFPRPEVSGDHQNNTDIQLHFTIAVITACASQDKLFTFAERRIGTSCLAAHAPEQAEVWLFSFC